MGFSGFSSTNWKRESVVVDFEEKELTDIEKADAIQDFIDDGATDEQATTKAENSIYRRAVVEMTACKEVTSASMTNTIINNYIDPAPISAPESVVLSGTTGGEEPTSGFDIWLQGRFSVKDLEGGGSSKVSCTWRGYGQWTLVTIEVVP
jgi:hypothetical protein